MQRVLNSWANAWKSHALFVAFCFAFIACWQPMSAHAHNHPDSAGVQAVDGGEAAPLSVAPQMNASQHYVAPRSVKKPELRVGMAGSAPFVVQGDDGELTGVVWEVWQDMAEQAGIEYGKPYRFGSVKSGIEAVNRGNIDVLIGPLTINAQRAKTVSFSQPYFQSDVGIVAPIKQVTLWQRVKPFFSGSFLYAVGMLLLLLFGLGVMLYFAERKKNPQFQNGFFNGVMSGSWLSLQTMNTTGYGDYAPKSFLGRVVMGIWMILSLILSTSLVAGIASTLALSAGQDNSYKQLSDLRGLRVATTGYHKLVNSIRSNGAMPVTAKNVQEAMQLLREGKVQAVVYDLVQLQYGMTAQDHERYSLRVDTNFPQDYGFAYPQNSVVRADLDVYMLNLREKDIIQHKVDEWVVRNHFDQEQKYKQQAQSPIAKAMEHLATEQPKQGVISGAKIGAEVNAGNVNAGNVDAGGGLVTGN